MSQDEQTSKLETPTETATETATNINHADVVEQFKKVHNKYTHQAGYMITTIPDELSKEFITKHPELKWKEVYNRYASENVYILSCTIYVTIFGLRFPVVLERPLRQDHHYEFEEYFGFGGHNAGYTTNRIIARMPNKFNDELDISTILTSREEVNDAYVKDVLLFLVLGGYIKYWKGCDELRMWFIEKQFNIESIKGSDVIVNFIMQNYEIVPEPQPETEHEHEHEPEAVIGI
jgi:hypothetical protein